jgi:ferredoxin--NADP+ reductase
MAYVIAEPCIENKSLSCIDVCPVDAIHPKPGEPGFCSADQLYINAEACIECGSCARVCPAKAAIAAAQLPSSWDHFIDANAAYFGRL